jgi:hypothetical protein
VTGLQVYADKGAGVWPVLVGHLHTANASVMIGKPMTELFQKLNTDLKAQGKRLQVIFDNFDTDSSGLLNNEKLGKLLTQVSNCVLRWIIAC